MMPQKQRNPIVLLVDDQPLVSEGVRRMLADEGDIEFHYCGNPNDAIETAIRVHPTVILQDLIMPNIDGFTLVRIFKSNATTKNIPIIVLSTKEDPHDKSRAFDQGASDYLVKLPDKIELVARVRAHTKNYILQTERDEAFVALGELQEQLQMSNSELQKLTCSDGLTGIANRRRFDEFIQKEFFRSAREKTCLSLLLLDIDYFKYFNDNYGHLGGDDCLRKVARALKNAVQRPADIVARYGGEEFAVVLPNTDLEGAIVIAESLRKVVQALEIPHIYSPISDIITVSVGIACIQACEQVSPLALIDMADKALYEAKKVGRNRCQVSRLI